MFTSWKKDPSKSDTSSVKDEADELKIKIDSGEDFASLANIYTDDPSNYVNPDSGKGGDLGFFGKGQMVPAFEEAAFNANPNEVLGPILSAFGYHIPDLFRRLSEHNLAIISLKYLKKRRWVMKSKFMQHIFF